MLTVCTLVVVCILVVHMMVSCVWTDDEIVKYTVCTDNLTQVTHLYIHLLQEIPIDLSRLW
jgi:hypothetical protein